VNGNDNTQTNRCDSVPGNEFVVGCENIANGNDNTQIINCFSVGVNRCVNRVTDFEPSNDNTQKMNCIFVSVGCVNEVTQGSGNTQDLLCTRMTSCNNAMGSFETPIDSKTQSTNCANAGSCSNVGVNTNVLANGADCESHEPDTITFCQPNRIIIRPNS
jgi:hypothetical protein